jgi:3'-5' exoribonuclease
MGHKFISEIAPGETINDVYMIREPILRSTTRGDLYIAMYICDRSGQLNGRMWQATEAVYNSLPKPGFVHINGRSEVYQSNLQIVVNNISVVDSSEVEIEDFLARTEKDIGKMFGEVKKIVGRIKHKQLKALVDEFLADEELMGKFCEAPAAMKLHHNYLGGLLEHTHNMLCVAEAVFGFYPEVNRDLVLAGIFIHDMGKTDELCYDMAFSYTDSGQLIGHISKGFVMLGEKAESLKSKGVEIDELILDSLGHIIISHHGQYEFGSPKLPATPEAFMVNYIDDLDAKIRQVRGVIENEPGDSDWSGWQNTLGTRLYKKRIE